MRRLLMVAVAVLLLGMLVAGCTRYRILTAEDHPTQKTTSLQLVRHQNYLFVANTEHQFWLCEDKGDELVCTRRCGGETDLACPSTVGGGGGITTNVR